ncbi:MAG: hypothetical protein COA45_07575 [Zetaproteobacteria bacterium]|nr:MAG: hypothetical protein COA45_07575 [Zetaproteobacteria bacterium]
MVLREGFLKMSKVSTAMSNLASSYDGEYVSYGNFERRVLRMMEYVENGPERDFLNFERDIKNAMNREYEQK